MKAKCLDDQLTTDGKFYKTAQTIFMGTNNKKFKTVFIQVQIVRVLLFQRVCILGSVWRGFEKNLLLLFQSKGKDWVIFEENVLEIIQSPKKTGTAIFLRWNDAVYFAAKKIYFCTRFQNLML